VQLYRLWVAPEGTRDWRVPVVQRAAFWKNSDTGMPSASNAILKADSRGAWLAKEHKDSPRRIDAAVSMVMAVHRAAELADSTPAIYA
jgi:phage terminase large subunit-like protein